MRGYLKKKKKKIYIYIYIYIFILFINLFYFISLPAFIASDIMWSNQIVIRIKKG